jgi:hypothetical protein
MANDDKQPTLAVTSPKRPASSWWSLASLLSVIRPNQPVSDLPLLPRSFPPVPPQQQVWVPERVWDGPRQQRNNVLYDLQPPSVVPPPAVGHVAGEGLAPTVSNASLSGASMGMVTGRAEMTLTGAPVTVGKTTIANRNAILVQSMSIELLLRDAIESRSNTVSLPELEAILAAVIDLRAILVTETSDANVGAQALSYKDALVNWWNKDRASILDRSFNAGLFVGGLMLVEQFGLVSAVTVAAAIHGKEFTEAIKAVADVLKRIGGSRD